MKLYTAYTILATATLGACLPNLENLHLRDLVNVTDGSQPITPAQAASVFANNTNKGVHFELIHHKLIPPPHQGIEKPARLEPITFQALNSSGPIGFDARLPASAEVSFEPAKRLPFSAVTSNKASIRSIFNPRACDPGYNCCPDPRFMFEDSNYPWSAIGRVTFPMPDGLHACGGSLVGPRHVLTAAHCVNWTKDKNGNIPWVAFEPQAWPGHTPWKYYAASVGHWDFSPQGDPTNQEQAATDYVILILEVPDNDTGLGWLGSRSYTTSWDNLSVFKHVGYPGQFDSSASTPFSEPYFSINNAFSPENFCIHQHGLAIQLNTCISKGDSGGPVFSWWSSGVCVGPCIVGVANEVGCFGVTCGDWSRKCGNYAAGGSEMVQLIIDQRNKYP